MCSIGRFSHLTLIDRLSRRPRRSLNQSIAELEEAIGNEGQKLEGHKNLTSVKGIGGLSAGILLSIIGDIDDFNDEGKPPAYFGIVPRISNSNETEHSGRITKRGTKLGRTTLVQSALIAQRYSPYLKACLRKEEKPRDWKNDHRAGS